MPDELLRFRERHADSRYSKFTEPAMIVTRFGQAVRARDADGQRAAHREAAALVERARLEDWPTGWRQITEECEEWLRLRLPEARGG